MKRDKNNTGSQKTASSKKLSFVIKSYILNPIYRRKKYIKIFSILLAITTLIFIGCDLFSGVASEDLLKKIDSDIAWSNAPSLSVRVAYPPEWGVSPQLSGFGDIRAGHEFEIGFIPNNEYALQGWRAYKTSELPVIAYDWMENPARFFSTQGSPKMVTEGVILPNITEGDGTGKATINITEPITLIPFCRAQPRITSSTPSIGQVYYRRAGPIVLNFAADLDKSTIKFGSENIRISMRNLDMYGQTVGPELFLDGVSSGDLTYYEDPVVNNPSGSRYTDRMIRIVPTTRTEIVGGQSVEVTGPPPDTEITLYLFRGLKTASGGAWEEEISPIKWRIRPNNCRVTHWEAKYKNKNIELNWSHVGADSATIRVIGAGGATINVPNPSFTTNTTNIPIPSVGDNDQLQIFIDLRSDGELFPMENGEEIRIWAATGDDGMTVNSDSTVIEINQSNYNPTNPLVWITNDPNVILVLTGNIIAGNWTPVGNSSANAFRGALYGLDRTITFQPSGTINLTQYMGIFGYMDGAKIYSLNIDYERTSSLSTSPSANVFIGGIAGYATGNTIISNSVVRGTGAGPGVLLNSSSGAGFEVNIGGLIGYHTGGNLVMQSSSSEIDIRVEKANAGNVYAGGMLGRATDTSVLTIGNTSTTTVAPGNVTVNNASGIISGIINAGGVIGRNEGSGNLQKITYSGNITLDSTFAGDHNIGGIVGLNNRSNITDCTVTGNITIGATSNSSTTLFVGGIGGNLNALAAYNITNCVAQGNITIGTVTNRSPAHIRAGGIAGTADGTSSSRITFNDCKYITTGVGSGDMAIYSSTSSGVYPENRIGGFVGCAVNTTFNNCESAARPIIVDKTQSIELRVGGFIGEIANNSITFAGTNTSSTPLDVTSAPSSPYITSAGGFAGRIYSQTLSNVSSSGNVTASGTGDLNVGGLVGFTNGIINDNSKATGAVKVTGTGIGVVNVHAGGLVGTATSITNSTASGEIIVTTTEVFRVGGLAGHVSGTITDSHATGNVTAEKGSNSDLNVAVNVGGLAGYAGGITLSSAKGDVSVKTVSPAAGGDLHVGGLAGNAGPISQSWAAGSKVEVTKNSGTGDLFAGGLTGSASGNVTRSWAKNNVIVNAETTGLNRVGGLAGRIENVIVEHCYALGDVTIINKTNAGQNAGGLVGLSGFGSMRYNFARGEVKVRSDAPGGNVYAGGIIGYVHESTLTYNVALGNSLTATSSSGTAVAYRVCSFPTSGAVINFNYARADMEVGTATGGSSVGNVTGATVISSDSTSRHGASQVISGLRVQNFWQNTIGFGTSYWNYSDLNSMRFPYLSAVGEADQHAARLGLDLPIPSYNITKNITGKGTINTSPTSPVPEGDEVTVTLESAPGYSLSSTTTTPSVSLGGSETTRSFTMPNNAITINATFTAENQPITINQTSNGTVTGPESAATDSTVNINIAPDTGYTIGVINIRTKGAPASGGEPAVLPNSPVIPTGSGNTRSFDMPAGGVDITVTFVTKSYSITLQGGGGAVGTGGTFSVSSGPYVINQDITINAIVTPGWRITNMTYAYFNGSTTITNNATWTSPNTTGTFKIPDAFDGVVTVNVVFEKITYTTSPTLNSWDNLALGRFRVTGTAVQTGNDLTVVSEPAAGYQVTKITINGADITTGLSNNYVFAVGDHIPSGTVITVAVEFEQKTYNVTPSGGAVGTGGTWTVTGPYYYNTGLNIVADPADGWQVSGMTTNNTLASSVTYTSGNNGTLRITDASVTTAITVSVTFTKIDYAVNAISSQAGGSFEIRVALGTAVTGPGTVTAQIGQEVLIPSGTINPPTGYQLKVTDPVTVSPSSVSVNNRTTGQAADRGYYFSMPASAVTVTVTFEEIAP